MLSLRVALTLFLGISYVLAAPLVITSIPRLSGHGPVVTKGKGILKSSLNGLFHPGGRFPGNHGPVVLQRPPKSGLGGPLHPGGRFPGNHGPVVFHRPVKSGRLGARALDDELLETFNVLSREEDDWGIDVRDFDNGHTDDLVGRNEGF